ncbi:MAG: hypothetical protein WCQ99_14200 [Pseudomonadota bacterium]
MLNRIKTGKLENILASKRLINIPKSENIQTIEVTKLPDGKIAEGEEYLRQQKQKKIEALRAKYGDIDENQLTWVVVKKTNADLL